MTDIHSKKILELIHEEHIVPDPTWKHLLKKYARWLPPVLLALLAAISFSAGLAFFRDVDWQVDSPMRTRTMFDAVHGISLFWLALLAVFLGLALFGLRKTERGYRMNRRMMLGSVALLVAILGVLFLLLRIGETVERNTKVRLPSYESREERNELLWSRPDEGMLGGTVSAVSADAVAVTDFSGSAWQVKLDPQTKIDPKTDFRKGKEVRVIGTKDYPTEFSAQEIAPWHRNGPKKGEIETEQAAPAGDE